MVPSTASVLQPSESPVSAVSSAISNGPCQLYGQYHRHPTTHKHVSSKENERLDTNGYETSQETILTQDTEVLAIFLHRPPRKIKETEFSAIM
jgi:hypothetical protein